MVDDNSQSDNDLLRNFNEINGPTLLIKGNTCSQSTAQTMKFSIKDFFSKCDQIRRKLRIRSHLLKKSLMENFIFCEVKVKDHVQILFEQIGNILLEIPALFKLEHCTTNEAFH